jgi:hypothetical protein
LEHSIHHNVRAVHVVAPAAIAANTNGASVDCLGFESLEFLFHVGAAMVGGGFDVTFEESDTGAFGGEQNAVATAEILGGPVQISIGDANKVFRAGYVGKKRHVRPVLTETGTITAGVVGCMALLSVPRYAPVADQNT